MSLKFLGLAGVVVWSGLVHADPSRTGRLKIGGEVVASDIEMRPIAHTAEVKPNGTILDTYCGNVSHSLEVCETMTQGTVERSYLVLRPFKKDPVYVKVQTPSAETYEGMLVQRLTPAKKYMVEKPLEFTVETTN